MNWRFLVKKKKKKRLYCTLFKSNNVYTVYLGNVYKIIFRSIQTQIFQKRTFTKKKKSKTYYAYSESISLLWGMYTYSIVCAIKHLK